MFIIMTKGILSNLKVSDFFILNLVAFTTSINLIIKKYINKKRTDLFCLNIAVPMIK